MRYIKRVIDIIVYSGYLKDNYFNSFRYNSSLCCSWKYFELLTTSVQSCSEPVSWPKPWINTPFKHNCLRSRLVLYTHFYRKYIFHAPFYNMLEKQWRLSIWRKYTFAIWVFFYSPFEIRHLQIGIVKSVTHILVQSSKLKHLYLKPVTYLNISGLFNRTVNECDSATYRILLMN